MFKTLVDADGGVVGTWELFDKVFQGGAHDSEDLDESATDSYKNRVWVCVANLRRKIDPSGEHSYMLLQNHYPRFRGAPSGHFRMLTKRPPSVDSGLDNTT